MDWCEKKTRLTRTIPTRINEIQKQQLFLDWVANNSTLETCYRFIYQRFFLYFFLSFLFMCFRTLNILLLVVSVFSFSFFLVVSHIETIVWMCRKGNRTTKRKRIDGIRCEKKCLNINCDSYRTHKV